MKMIRRLFTLVLITAIVGVVWFAYAVLWSQSDDATEQTFTIESGHGVNTISANLHTAGLIKNTLAFETYLWLIKKEGAMIAGTYALRPSLTLRELTRVLTSGAALSRERTITILEGWDREQIAFYLDDAHIVRAEAFLAASEGQEGHLFPDTYRIFDDATATDIVAKLTGTFDERVRTELASTFSAQQRSFDDVIILASMLEKEVRSEEEMRMAADLFWRRLDIGMALQADSTVNFVTRGKNPSITFADRDIDSPYNTYKYAGLPPGSIGNPGLQAIRAALNPQPNAFWFFLTTADDGRAIFSKTLDEHNANVQKYLR